MDLTDDPLAGVDASELDALIEKEIDKKFVEKTKGQEPSLAEEAPPRRARRKTGRESSGRICS